MDDYRFAGYRILEFSSVRKDALQEVGELLSPYRDSILQHWANIQCKTWQPPGLTRKDLETVFGRLLDSILNCMCARKPELCVDELAEAGSELAARDFPFEALIISIHFLEKSYLPFLLRAPSEKTREWLLGMDEFLHAALAAVATAYFESYRRELLDLAEVGRVVQEGLLSDIPKRIMDLDVAHAYISARERARLGGDFLDSFSVCENKTAFIIGDLSGHGLEAAADSVMIRSLFKGFMSENPDLADAMSRLNRVLTRELKSGQFATAVAMTYEPTGCIDLVCAGHPCPMICDGVCRQVPSDGMALAIDSDAEYSARRIILEPSGVLVAYTDGLTEARKRGPIYGEERTMEAITAVWDSSARGVADHLIDEALRFAGGKFADDVAILVLKRRKNVEARS